MSAPGPDPASASSGALRLGLLFGALAFLQGIGEPTEGLPAQPVRSLLLARGRTAGEVAGFMAMLAIPWAIKPAFGLLTDVVPLLGTRRKGYLVLAGGATAFGLLGLFARAASPAGAPTLLAWLMVPAAATALGDVAADALLIERARPRGLTGTLQAVQWGCLYASGIVNGLAGGALSVGGRQRWAFAACGVGGLLTFALALTCVREPRRPPGPAATRGFSIAPVVATARAARPLAVVGAFLFLFNFNPFSNAVLHVHMTRALGLSESFFGTTVALTAVASIAASVGYGFYCRRVAFPTLLHASIALGVVSTLGYALVVDERSAIAATLALAATYMTATLIQLDLAARACPPASAGTVFALIMALENLGAAAATYLGGLLYDWGLARWGARPSFLLLVLVGSATTACCWLLVPFLPTAAAPPQSAGEPP